MLVHAFGCDAPECSTMRTDENDMLTATVTIKGTPGYPRYQFKVHACNLNHLALAVQAKAEQ